MLSQKYFFFWLLNDSICVSMRNGIVIFDSADEDDAGEMMRYIAHYISDHRGIKQVTLEVLPLKFMGISG